MISQISRSSSKDNRGYIVTSGRAWQTILSFIIWIRMLETTTSTRWFLEGRELLLRRLCRSCSCLLSSLWEEGRDPLSNACGVLEETVSFPPMVSVCIVCKYPSYLLIKHRKGSISSSYFLDGCSCIFYAVSCFFFLFSTLYSLYWIRPLPGVPGIPQWSSPPTQNMCTSSSCLMFCPTVWYQ